MSKRQEGYALIETLIAAAVAAGVVVVVAQSLAIVARAAGTAKSLNAVVSEAEMIAARLEAGVYREADLLAGASGWTIQSAPYEPVARRRAGGRAQLRLYTVTHEERPGFSFQRIILREAG